MSKWTVYLSLKVLCMVRDTEKDKCKLTPKEVAAEQQTPFDIKLH